jgi:hypothetical protein
MGNVREKLIFALVTTSSFPRKEANLNFQEKPFEVA